jgi:hypothetical protein
MPDQTKRYQCRHIFTDGHRCGSPCLRQEEFCYYHHTTRRPIENPGRRRCRQARFDLPLPEDRGAIQSSIGEVLRRIAGNEIDSKRAGLLLYGLQIASLNLPRATQPSHAAAPLRDAAPVEEIVADPTYGTLAPRAEVAPPEKRTSIIAELFEQFARDEAEAAAAEAADAAESKELALAQTAILPSLQAQHAGPERQKTCRKARPNRHPVSPGTIRIEKSGKKLTQPARIAIVRGFREYSDHVVGETRCVEGGEKPRSFQSFPVARQKTRKNELDWIQEKDNHRAS